jgi:hypothetical protein
MTQDELFELDYQNWQNGHSDEAAAETVFEYFYTVTSSITSTHTNTVVDYAKFILHTKESGPKYSGYAAAGLPEDYVNLVVRLKNVDEAKRLYAHPDIKFMVDNRLIWGEVENFLSLVTGDS